MRIVYALIGLLMAGAASAAEPDRSGTYVELFGAYAWPGNISAGGETDPTVTVTLERSGEYAFGGGAGYQFDNGIHLGGKVRYARHGCDESAGPDCAELIEGYELEMSTLGILATAGYTLETGLIVDPFIEADVGFGYVSLICEEADSCPAPGVDHTVRPHIAGTNPNYADGGLMYGVCGGLKGPLTDDRRLEFLADACWHRIEGVSVTGVPHWDAPDAITAGLRVRYRL